MVTVFAVKIPFLFALCVARSPAALSHELTNPGREVAPSGAI
jgi:hypothetical protein